VPGLGSVLAIKRSAYEEDSADNKFDSIILHGGIRAGCTGLKTDKAPPPPHKMEDGYRGMEDARSMTIQQAKTMHDGASVSLKGNLVKKTGKISISSATKPGKLTSISQWPFSMAKMSPRTNWWALAGR
jgi:hypothetical protein